MAYLTSIWFIVIIAMASSKPQFFPNQGFPQQTGNPFFQNQAFPNQNFQGQTFPNQGFQGQGFPNQGFQGQPFANQGFSAFPNQGFSNQGFPNQQQSNGQFPLNQNFQNQRLPNQGNQNNQFAPNGNNPFLQGNPNSNQANPSNSDPSGTLEEFTQQNQNQNQNQRPFNQQQPQQPQQQQQFNQQQQPNQNQQSFNQIQPTQPTPSIPVTTPSALPAQSPALIACARNCPTTSEYNPVCGSDQVSYNNIRRLDCANMCGARLSPNWQSIQVVREGSCTSGQRVP